RRLFEGRITWIEGRKCVWIDIRYRERRLKHIVGERKIEVETPLLDILERSSEDRSSIVRRVTAEILIREEGNPGINARECAESFASHSSMA
ncbi:hypothetical protein CWC09_18970, partial [Pseudoalteromonas ruthenica]